MVFSRFKHLFAAEGQAAREIILTGHQGSRCSVGDQELINLSSSDYLGFCSSPKTIQAFKHSIEQYGFALIFESSLSSYFNKDDSILYSSGYDSNKGIFEAILNKNDEVFIDKQNNPTLFDGPHLAECKVFKYCHNSLKDLESALESSSSRIKLIVTDGIFPYSGEFAPLKELSSLAQKYSSLLLVDESHGFGTVADGRGVSSFYKVLEQVDIVNLSLGKALGGATGGATIGRQEIIDVLRQRSRNYIFTNALAPMVAGTCLEMMNELSQEKVETLGLVIQMFRERLRAKGFQMTGHEKSPIATFLVPSENLCLRFQEKLLELNIFASAIVFPLVPRGQARIRVQFTINHLQDIDAVVEGFGKVGKELEIIDN